MRGIVLLFGVLLVTSAMVPGVALGAVSGEPKLEVTASDTTFTAGEDTQLTVAVSNAGVIYQGNPQNPGAEQRVMTARGLTVELDAEDAPLTVESGPVALGALPDGGVARPSFAISVDEDAEPGTYEVEATAHYTHTATVAERNAQGQVENEEMRRFDIEITIDESADITVVDVEEALRVGERGTVAFTYENTGTQTAHDASVAVQSSNAALTFGGAPTTETYLGDIAPGERRTVTLRATVAPGSEERSYALSSTFSYEDADGVPQRQQQTAGVTPTDGDRFTVVGVDTDATAGGSGTVSVELRNTGGEDLTDTSVTVQSSNAALTFGGASTASSYVGSWADGETRTLTFESTLSPAAEERPYALDLTVTFENSAGDERQSTTMTAGVTPEAEQEFSVDGVQGTLRVGEEGTLTGTLTNEGPGDVENAVLVLQPAGANVDITESEYAVGGLASGSSVEFSYDLDVSEAAAAGPKQFTMRLEYEDADGTSRQSDALFARVEVGEQRDQFGVEPVDNSFSVGSSGTLRLRVTNNGDEPVSSVSAKLFADSPISADSDEAFVTELGPGESTVVEFDVSVAGGAAARTFPVSVDFQYEEADGDTELTDTFRVPVQVTAEEDNGGFLSLVVGLLQALGSLLPGSLGVQGLVVGVVGLGLLALPFRR